MDQTVATADNPPVVLGRMPVEFVRSVGPSLRCATGGRALLCALLAGILPRELLCLVCIGS